MSIIIFCLAIQVYLILKDRRQRYFRCYQINKKACAMFNKIGPQQTALPRLYIDKGGRAK